MPARLQYLAANGSHVRMAGDLNRSPPHAFGFGHPECIGMCCTCPMSYYYDKDIDR